VSLGVRGIIGSALGLTTAFLGVGVLRADETGRLIALTGVTGSLGAVVGLTNFLIGEGVGTYSFWSS